MAALVNQAVKLVQQWHTALNNGDVTSLMALVDPLVQIVGPRGTAEGVLVVKEWVERAKVKLLPQRYFVQGDIVVVEEVGEWYATDTERITGSQLVATVFRVKKGTIISIQRYHDLEAAKLALGLPALPEIYPE